MKMIFDWINNAILFILAVSTLVGIADYVGLLHPKVRKWLHLNRTEDMVKTLEELGIETEQRRRVNLPLNRSRTFHGANVEESAKNALEAHKISGSISLGRTINTNLDYYYDLIGATCDSANAEYFAQIMSTYWYSHLTGDNKIEKFDFDFVVTPKAGSPILGYEFSKIVKKPFVLHEDSRRFSMGGDVRELFDCCSVPPEGSTALIVDDSTTGGRMVCQTINDLRDHGYRVYTCFVIFEPKKKNARETIAEKNVDLISVVKTHEN